MSRFSSADESGDQVPRTRPLTTRAPLAACALGAIAGVVVDRFGLPMQTGSWLTCLLVVGVIRLRFRPRPWPTFLVYAMLGGFWHHLWWWDVGRSELARSPRWPAAVRGVIADEALFRRDPAGVGTSVEGFTRTLIEVQDRLEQGAWRPFTGRVLTTIPGDRSDLRPGDPVTAFGVLGPIEGPLNPGETGARNYWRGRGVWSKLSVDSSKGIEICESEEVLPNRRLRWLGRVRIWSHERLVAALDPAIAPLASALLLGRRDEVDPELNAAFARTGTTHLLAISGLHLQALAVLFYFLFRAAGFRNRTSALYVGLASLGYGALVGFAPSVVRSTAMTVLACVGLGARSRPPDSAQMLSAAALATIAWSPANVFDAGCQLSFLAVAVILWGVPAVTARLRRPPGPLDPISAVIRFYESSLIRLGRWLIGKVVEALLISAVIWLAAWPLTASRFHNSSPLGMVLNPPLILLTTLALFGAGLTLILSAIWLPLAGPVSWATARLLHATDRLVRWGADQSWGNFSVGGPPEFWVLGFYALLALMLCAKLSGWKQARRLWIPLAGWVAFGVFGLGPAPTTAVDVLAVGHGLAVVVRSEGKTVLYDAGRMRDPSVGRRIIAPALWSFGVRKLDAVFLSHSDSDHYNGILDVLDRFSVEQVLIPSGFSAGGDAGGRGLLEAIRARRVPVRVFDAGAVLQLSPSTRLTSLHPPQAWGVGTTDNARSLVLDVDSNDRHVLLTGDIEGPGLMELPSTHSPPPGGFDVVLSPHHGSKLANPPSLFEWAAPRWVVVSQKAPLGATSDLDGPLGVEPADDLKEPPSEAVGGRALIYRTWRGGAIHVEWTDAGLAVSGFLDHPTSPSEQEFDRMNIHAILDQAETWRPWLVAISALALGLISAFTLFAVEWGAWALVAPKRRLEAPQPLDDARGETAIEATAVDGTRLVGSWFASSDATSRTLLLLHGLAEDRSGLRAQASSMNAKGWSVAILDGRGFGESGGAAVAFGGFEADDLSRWLDRILPEPQAKAAVWGRSMGAAITLRAAESDPRIGALILEAPYADLRQTLAKVLKRYRLPLAQGLARLTLARASGLAGTALDQPRPVDLAAKVKTPTLLMRGTADRLVSIEETDRLAKAFPYPPERLEIPQAGHRDIFALGGEALVETIAAFLDRAMPPVKETDKNDFRSD